jgi:hypothetical protein
MSTSIEVRKIDVAQDKSPAAKSEQGASAVLAFILRSRAEVLSLDPKTLPDAPLIVAFVVATRMKNAIERRVAALRKAIDALLARPGYEVAPGSPGVSVAAGEYVVARINSAANARVFSEEKVRKLCAKKKIDFDANCCVDPEPILPPPRHFSGDKFKALLSLEMITLKEYDACLESAPPACTTTVQAPEGVDLAISKVMLGEPPSSSVKR